MSFIKLPEILSFFNIAKSSQNLQYISRIWYTLSATIKTNYKKIVETYAIISKLCRHLAKNICNFRAGAI